MVLRVSAQGGAHFWARGWAGQAPGQLLCQGVLGIIQRAMMGTPGLQSPQMASSGQVVGTLKLVRETSPRRSSSPLVQSGCFCGRGHRLVRGAGEA